MDEPSYEELQVIYYVALAKQINKECGERTLHAQQDPYAGFSCDENRLESAIAAPLQVIADVPRYETHYERAAALLVHLARSHAFQDGNKRTALKLAVAYLAAHGFTVDMESPEKAADLVEWTVTCNDRSIDDVIAHVTMTFARWTRKP